MARPVILQQAPRAFQCLLKMSKPQPRICASVNVIAVQKSEVAYRAKTLADEVASVHFAFVAVAASLNRN